MRIWIDLSNSPHVPLFRSLVSELGERGHDVLITARDHAQTVPLARETWPDVEVVGGRSPGSRVRKGRALLERAARLRNWAQENKTDVALSHGSYAQIVASRASGIPAVTMMDYEYQPANHLSFRLATRVVVPSLFPSSALAKFGAKRKALRYPGFKEEIYLTSFVPDHEIVRRLRIDPDRVLVVMRPPPEGALYHRHTNDRFAELVREASTREDVEVVLLPRNEAHRAQFDRLCLTIPATPVDALSLLSIADLAIGAGGTMNREGALLGTRTYTVFSGRIAAVDLELMRLGLLHDLRAGSSPTYEKKSQNSVVASPVRRRAIVETVAQALEDAAGGSEHRFRRVVNTVNQPLG
jgi:hypothetical protein